MNENNEISEESYKVFRMLGLFMGILFGGVGLIAVVQIMVFEYSEIITKQKILDSISSSLITLVFCAVIWIIFVTKSEYKRQEEEIDLGFASNRISVDYVDEAYRELFSEIVHKNKSKITDEDFERIQEWWMKYFEVYST